MLQGGDSSKIDEFNLRFQKWGVGIKTKTPDSDVYQTIAVKGDVAWDILETVAGGITTSDGLSPMGLVYTAPANWVLEGLDTSQATLAMWHTAHTVFKVARKTRWPSPEQIRLFPGQCHTALVAYRWRTSRQRTFGDYPHIVYMHGHKNLRFWGTLDVLSNQDTEAQNKEMTAILQKTQHDGSVGRISTVKLEEQERAGLSFHDRCSRRSQNQGLRGVAEAVQLQWALDHAHVFKALSDNANSDPHPPLPAGSGMQSPQAHLPVPSALPDSPPAVRHRHETDTPATSPMATGGSSCASPSEGDQLAGRKHQHSEPRTTSSQKRRPPKRLQGGSSSACRRGLDL